MGLGPQPDAKPDAHRGRLPDRFRNTITGYRGCYLTLKLALSALELLNATARVADTWSMTRRLGTVVLACAALGSLAFAGVRIADAKERRLGYYEKYVQPHIRVYGTTPALAGVTLRSLRRPPGFRAVPCMGLESIWACWARSPSVPLGNAAMGRLFAAMGITPYSAYKATYGDAVPAIQCRPFHKDRKYHLAVQTCQGEALEGKERLVVFATSIVTPADNPRTRGVVGFRYPTEVNVALIGHFEHEGIRSTEESE